MPNTGFRLATETRAISAKTAQLTDFSGSMIVCALIIASPILTSRSPSPFGPNALRRHSRALEQQKQFVCQHIRLGERSRGAQANKPLALSGFERLNHPPRRVVLFGQFDGGVRQRAATLIPAGHVASRLFEPGTELRGGVTRMAGLEAVPRQLGAFCQASEVFCNQLILRREVPVERHLVGLGSFNDRLDPNGADAMAIKELRSGRQDPLAW
jgi:hypothetical protein